MAESRLSPLDALAGQVGALARRLDGLEEDRRSDGVVVRQMAVRMGIPVDAGEPEGSESGTRDDAIYCPACAKKHTRTKVGYYDEGADLVRVRHREHLVLMRMGPGGSITIFCRLCSYPVPITYAPPDNAALVEARDGLLVLDVATCTDLLERALGSGSGQVTLKLVGSPKS